MSPIFGLLEQVDCSTANEFLNQISPVGAIFDRFSPSEKWIYRGVGDDGFRLVPSAFRDAGRAFLFQISAAEIEPLPDKTFNAVQWFAEAAAISEFLGRVDEMGLPFPEDSQTTRRQLALSVMTAHNWAKSIQKKRPQAIEIRNPDYWIPEVLLSFVAVAQHYGIPTRILDWSWSPFVAAYFAARDALETRANHFAVFALFANELGIRRRFYRLFESKGLTLGIVTVPRASNPNVHAQEGVFTWFERFETLPIDEWHPYTIEDGIDGLKNSHADYAPLIYKITLPGELAPAVLWKLDKLGFNATKLFPGFYGAVRAIRERLEIRT